jgi:hypothetical protein
MKNVASVITVVCICAIAVVGQVYPRIDQITIERFKPSTIDLRAIRFMDKSSTDLSDNEVAARHPIYVVKIVAEMPAIGARQPRLLIGDKNTPTAGSFSKGMYVKVYTKKQLADWAGKSVTIIIPTPASVKNAPQTVVLFPDVSELTSLTAESEPGTLREVLDR